MIWQEMIKPPEIPSVEQTKAVDRLEARKSAYGRAKVVPRIISASAAGLAISAAIALVTLSLIHCFQPNFLPWTIKSAVPLILIGVAFASFQFALPRTRCQLLLGSSVSVAFILWGTEQFLVNQAIVSVIDDLVVFLFVIDLGIVICGSLRRKNGETGLSG
jgi:hypothetical protein